MTSYCPGDSVCDHQIADVISFFDTSPFEMLRLPGAKLSADGIIVVARSERLRGLDLSGAALDPGALKALGLISCLESLRVADCEIFPDQFDFLSELDQLTHLDVSGTRFDDNSLAFIRAPSLQNLDLSGTAITVAALPRLRQFRSLRLLHLRRTTIGLSAISEFSSAPELSIYV